jgi:DNA-binding transcriptional MerR regulator
MKMKELEARTGVSREAIRFYIREGMLPEPERPKRNQAFYSEDHVRRLKAIRKLQEEKFLPLSVIKSVINSEAFDALTAHDAMPGIEDLLPALVYGVAAKDSPLADVIAATSLDAEELRRLHEIGVIEIRASDGREWVDFRDAAILKTWGELREAGLTAERGFGIDLLERYVEFIDWLAREEVRRFVDGFAADTDVRTAADIAARGIGLVNELITRLHTRALTRRVSQSQISELTATH